jgi:putative Mg2+ transporter-C (MgtC) family protein
MPLTLSWEQIALRLLLACVASLVIGLNRDEQGHPAGMRTTMLVCLAAALAMIQVNLLLAMSGKTPSSFAVMDLMRLPLGILSGIGFIGAGVIVKREGTLVTGVTTAATMWLVTVLGLLFGGGQLITGVAGTVLAVVILWVLKYVEDRIPREHHGQLKMALSEVGLAEEQLRQHFLGANFTISRWCVTYGVDGGFSNLQCELKWQDRASRQPHTPNAVAQLASMPGVLSVTWEA